MPIETTIERDLRWREAELSSLKRLTIVADAGSVAQKSLLRALWAMLYAHYEGFTKFCWDALLDEIQASGRRVGEVQDHLAVLALQKEFRRLRGDMAPESIWNFYSVEFPVLLSASLRFDEEARIKTNSNLWPDTFVKGCVALGVVCDEVEKHRTQLSTLVARRNDIAHGKEMTISSVEEYSRYENAAMCVMHELGIKVLELANDRAYLRPD
jgi:hypothetical protein